MPKGFTKTKRHFLIRSIYILGIYAQDEVKEFLELVKPKIKVIS